MYYDDGRDPWAVKSETDIRVFRFTSGGNFPFLHKISLLSVLILILV